MNFKPYKDIETAVKQYRNDYYLNSEVKVKCHNNINKDERSLIDAAILCKVLVTFCNKYSEFKRKYNIEHIGHTFWDHTTWQLKYKDSICAFVVHSSSFITGEAYLQNYFKDKDCDEYDVKQYAWTINNHIEWLLDSLKEYAPSERYYSIREHIEKICTSD